MALYVWWVNLGGGGGGGGVSNGEMSAIEHHGPESIENQDVRNKF